MILLIGILCMCLSYHYIFYEIIKPQLNDLTSKYGLRMYKTVGKTTIISKYRNCN